MAGAFTCGRQYLYQSNMRCAAMIDGAIEVAKEIAVNDNQRAFISSLENWWNTKSYPGVDIPLDELFTTIEQQRFWAQAFHTLAWKCFHRPWGNQENETWQVGFICACHAVALMLCGLVWKAERNSLWFPKRTDANGILPDLMRLQSERGIAAVNDSNFIAE